MTLYELCVYYVVQSAIVAVICVVFSVAINNASATKTLALSLHDALPTSSADTLAIGKYCWRAEYSGDGFYNDSKHTNSTTECFTTVKQPIGRATSRETAGGREVPGTAETDSATVTGSQGGPTPSGTVDFFLCQPATVTANGGDCSAGGTKVGATKTLVNGSATSDQTASADTLAIGKYCWRAEYSGDGFYNDSKHTNSTTECFTTVKQDSGTTTHSSTTSNTVGPGTTVSDTASVAGILNGPAPTRAGTTTARPLFLRP